MIPDISEIIFSFIARYFQQQGDELVLCVTGTVGSVITGRAVPRTGTAAEKQSGFLLRFPGQEQGCENFPRFPRL
jgi:hypothetical protein